MDDRDLSQLLTPVHVDVPDAATVRERGRSIRRRRQVGAVAGGVLVVIVAVLIAPGLLGSTMSVDIGPAGRGSQPPGEQLLRTALLTVEDLPAGWKSADIDQPTSRPTEGAVDVCGHDTTPTTEPAAQVATNFGKDTFLTEGLMSMEPAVAASAMRSITDATNDCTTWEQPSNGQPMTWQLEHLDAPDLGDESVAIRIAGGSDGTFIWNYEWIIWRDGPVLAFVSRWGIGNELGNTSPLPDIARTAADKLHNTLTIR